MAVVTKPLVLDETVKDFNKDLVGILENMTKASESAERAIESASVASESATIAESQAAALIEFLNTKATLTAPAVDATLAVSGAAADAKAVSDEIGRLEKAIDYTATAYANKVEGYDGAYKIGSVSATTHAPMTATNRIRINRIDASECKYWCLPNSGWSVRFYGYTSLTDAYADCYIATTPYEPCGPDIINRIPAEFPCAMVLFKKNDDSDITAENEEYFKESLIRWTNTLSHATDEEANTIDLSKSQLMNYVVDIPFVRGNINVTNGKLSTTSEYSQYRLCSSAYVKFPEKKIRVTMPPNVGCDLIIRGGKVPVESIRICESFEFYGRKECEYRFGFAIQKKGSTVFLSEVLTEEYFKENVKFEILSDVSQWQNKEWHSFGSSHTDNTIDTEAAQTGWYIPWLEFMTGADVTDHGHGGTSVYEQCYTLLHTFANVSSDEEGKTVIVPKQAALDVDLITLDLTGNSSHIAWGQIGDLNDFSKYSTLAYDLETEAGHHKVSYNSYAAARNAWLDQHSEYSLIGLMSGAIKFVQQYCPNARIVLLNSHYQNAGGSPLGSTNLQNVEHALELEKLAMVFNVSNWNVYKNGLGHIRVANGGYIQDDDTHTTSLGGYLAAKALLPQMMATPTWIAATRWNRYDDNDHKIS